MKTKFTLKYFELIVAFLQKTKLVNSTPNDVGRVKRFNTIGMFNGQRLSEDTDIFKISYISFK